MLSVQWKINNLFKGTKILYCCRNQQFCFYKNAYILEFSSLQLFKSKEKHTVLILYLKSFTLLITFFSERKFLNDKNYKIVKKYAINSRIDGTVYFWPGRGTICGACATCIIGWLKSATRYLYAPAGIISFHSYNISKCV